MNRILLIIIICIIAIGFVGGIGVYIGKRFSNPNFRSLINEPRVDFSCDTLKNFEYKSEFQEGSWGLIPENLRVLPDNAKLCGFVPSHAGVVISVKEQNDEQLFNFYREKLPTFGCEYRGTMAGPPQGSMFREALYFACDQKVGSIFTYRTENAYMLTFGAPAPRPSVTPGGIPQASNSGTTIDFVPSTPGTVTPPKIPSTPTPVPTPAQ